MGVSVADVRSVDELVRVVADGGQPKYLMFWGHQPSPGGGVGKGCFSQWWPGLNLLGFALMEVRHRLRADSQIS